MMGSRIVKIVRFSALPNWAKKIIEETSFPVDPMDSIDRTVDGDRLFIVNDGAIFNGRRVKANKEPLSQFEEE